MVSVVVGWKVCPRQFVFLKLNRGSHVMRSGSDRRDFPLTKAVTNWRRFSRYRKWKYGVGRGQLESLSPAVCVSAVKSRIARTTLRQRSTRFPIDSSRNELATFFCGTGSGNMASVVVGWKVCPRQFVFLQ